MLISNSQFPILNAVTFLFQEAQRGSARGRSNSFNNVAIPAVNGGSNSQGKGSFKSEPIGAIGSIFSSSLTHLTTFFSNLISYLLRYFIHFAITIGILAIVLVGLFLFFQNYSNSPEFSNKTPVIAANENKLESPTSIHLTLGIPSNASKQLFDDYLVIREQYALSYNNNKRIPN